MRERMVYAHAARKTVGLMALAMVLSLGVVTFIYGGLDTTITGNVVANTSGANTEVSSWMIVLLGMFVGALMVGGYVFVAHLEAKRNE